jgi:hypothetical protein
MKSVDQMTPEEAREQVKKFRRLLNPVWMQLAYQALGDNPKPAPDATMFAFSGGGGSDWTTFADFEELMGDPWKSVGEAA